MSKNSVASADKQEEKSELFFEQNEDPKENESLLFTNKVVTNILGSKQSAISGEEKIIINDKNIDDGLELELNENSGRETGILCRTVLWYLAFVGFAINYMIRINVNIAIVDMIMPKKITNTSDSFISECIVRNLNATNAAVIAAASLAESNKTTGAVLLAGEKERVSFERGLFNLLNVDYDKHGFEWNEKQQGLLLGSFYWIHWVTQVPGGILARKYGTKRIFGISNCVGCLLCALIPILSFIDLKLVLILRTLQGFILGCAWPSMHHLTAQWIPPNERSKFVSAYLGSSIGIAVFFPIFGYVISWSSWEWVFHLSAFFGLIWFIGWQYFVYDSPAKHPRIDPRERAYIEKSLGGSFLHENKVVIPWRHILASLPVWSNVISQFGGIWALFTLMTQAPTYFKTVLGWDVKLAGLLSGFPHLMRMIFAYYFSVFADYLLRENKLSRTNVRKLAGVVCNIVNGFFLIALAFSGCNSIAAVIFLTLATSVHGAVSTGPLASVVDLSPNFSGIVLGMNGMIGVLPGFISPIVVGYLTMNNQTVQQWQYVFLIASAMAIATGIQYIIFSSSELQSWNDLSKSKALDLNEQETKLCDNKDDCDNENNSKTINKP